MGEGIVGFFFPEELFRPGTFSGVHIFCFFSWTPSETALFGVFSLLCSDGAKVVFLGAIFLTVIRRWTKAGGAILLSLVTLACGGLNLADRLLSGSLKLLHSCIISRGIFYV